VSGHEILTTSMSGRCIKRAGRNAGPFYFVGPAKIPVSKEEVRIKRRSFHEREVAFWGVVKSLVSPFVSKVSISPSAISVAAIATNRRLVLKFFAA
jgi:hypothetical protein